MGAVSFLQFKEFELHWGAVFFLKSVHTFSWFLKSNWSCDFGHAETWSGAKKRVVYATCNFSLYFQSREKTVFEQKFAFSLVGFLFTCGNFTSIFTVFWSLDRILFLNGFPNQFIDHSRPSFFLTNFSFVVSGFLFTCGILTLIFLINFLICCCWNWFSQFNHKPV